MASKLSELLHTSGDLFLKQRIFICLLIAGVGVCLLIILGVVYVVPYRRVSMFQAATCTVQDSHYVPEWQTCPWSNKYNSKYPCLQLNVEVEADSRTWTTMIHYNEQDLARNVQCSYKKNPYCFYTENENEADIKAFAATWGRPGQTYSCWYNPDVENEVIQHLHTSSLDVIHYMLWPALMVVMGTVLLTAQIIVSNRRKGYISTEQP